LAELSAHRLADSLNAGFILIAGSSISPSGDIAIGMEGHKQSGFGFEGGVAGLASYTVSSAVYMSM
jgi:gamma-glutamyl-gamma-aminobutyraldehyde dehydrogenase/4-guanidinobutyraldehyde dehydrogenase/NAD-dependent aldehyde dehydrogenase